MIRIILLLLFVPLHLFAGNGWIGSGGDMITDEKNPWWVNNKKQIVYCVKFDQASMSVSKSQALEVVKHAFNNWLTEWRHFNKGTNYNLKIGEQRLVYNSVCLNNEDLVFHFGWGSLNDEEQKNFLKSGFDIKKRGGAAVRTEYDRVQMMGKGFIYIASDIGPNKLDLGEKYFQKPWQHKYLLNALITHELGHVFGFQHSSNFTLMKEDFLSWLLLKPNFEQGIEFEKGKQVEVKKPNDPEADRDAEVGFEPDLSYLDTLFYIQFFSNTVFEGLSFKTAEKVEEIELETSQRFDDMDKLLGMKTEGTIQLRVNNLDPTAYEIFYQKENQTAEKTHTLRRKKGGIFLGSTGDYLDIFLPPEQKVFKETGVPPGSSGSFWIPVAQRDDFVGELINLRTNEIKTVFASLNRDNFVMRSIVNGEAQVGLFWANYWKPVVSTLDMNSDFIQRRSAKPLSHSHSRQQTK